MLIAGNVSAYDALSRLGIDDVYPVLSWDCIRILLQDTGFQPLYGGASVPSPTNSIELQLHVSWKEVRLNM